MKNPGKVLIVPRIDVEGPSDCGGKGDMHGYKNWGKYRTWGWIERSVSIITDEEFRKSHSDSNGNPIKYSWAWLNWVGFLKNPREQVCGIGALYDHYQKILGENMKSFGDGDIWHYHHPRPDGSWFSSEKYPFEQWNRDFGDNTTYLDILAHYLVDRNWFPLVFSAGASIEDENLSQFLEKYIPIDFSSRGGDCYYPKGEPLLNTPAAYPATGPILFDWRDSPSDWSFYHPSVGDYRKPGDMKRVIFMCLDHGRLHSLGLMTKERMRKGFERAANGEDVVISYFSHDFVPELADVIDQAHGWAVDASEEYGGIGWRYETALKAAKEVLKKEDMELKISFGENRDSIIIETNRELFGPPFVVSKSDSYNYSFVNVQKRRNSYEINKKKVPKNATIYVSATGADFNNTTSQYKIQSTK